MIGQSYTQNRVRIGHTRRKFPQVSLLEDLGSESSITLYRGDGALIIWEWPNEVACGYWRWIECFTTPFPFEKGQGQADVAKVGMCVVGRVGKGRSVAPREYCNTHTRVHCAQVL